MNSNQPDLGRSATEFVAVLVSILLLPFAESHANPSIPWECSNYEGDAQIRCLVAFNELQREKLAELEEHLQAQQGLVGQLRAKVDRQAATTADLQQQLSERSTTTIVPFPSPYIYAYPPSLGFGLYFGQPWFYGAPYLYRPYWGPRYDRRWRHRW